jgi:hypothetical protein
MKPEPWKSSLSLKNSKSSLAGRLKLNLMKKKISPYDKEHQHNKYLVPTPFE